MNERQLTLRTLGLSLRVGTTPVFLPETSIEILLHANMNLLSLSFFFVLFFLAPHATHDTLDRGTGTSSVYSPNYSLSSQKTRYHMQILQSKCILIIVFIV